MTHFCDGRPVYFVLSVTEWRLNSESVMAVGFLYKKYHASSKLRFFLTKCPYICIMLISFQYPLRLDSFQNELSECYFQVYYEIFSVKMDVHEFGL